MKDKRIAFIGAGNMGRAIIGGLVNDGYPSELITAADPEAEAAAAPLAGYGVGVGADNHAAVAGADIVVLSIKPQVMAGVCRDLAAALAPGTLVVSIAAGIRLASLQAWLGDTVQLVRAMPNTPALIGCGAAALAAGARVTDEQRSQAENVLRAVGLTVWLDEEAQIDAVTALSGSGPAYFFLLMETLQQAGEGLGLDEEQTRMLTLQTALGAARLALEAGTDPGVLRRQVTSPGGTTEAALAVLTGAGLDETVARALTAARDRSIALADEFGNS